MNDYLKAPFPWFGGKSRIAPVVWQALGDVDHYCEPFFGSGAVLLQRPNVNGLETVNDKDCYVANAWRAIQNDPEGVAQYADNPVNEADLTARHIWLANTGAERVKRLMADPDYYDVKVAGWWLWGLASWIGGSWCSGTGPWTNRDGLLVDLREERDGVNGEGQGTKNGVEMRRPHLGNSGQGVNRSMLHSMADMVQVKSHDITENCISIGKPHLGRGHGVHRYSLHNYSRQAVSQCEYSAQQLREYMCTLRDRLRLVRICCGDWTRVVTRGALSHGSRVGVFLDPPYARNLRRNNLYNVDEANISDAVREWAIAHGDDPRLRIVLCGYDSEHEMPPSWKCVAWTAGRAYGNSRSPDRGNRFKERIWLSPHCVWVDQDELF